MADNLTLPAPYEDPSLPFNAISRGSSGSIHVSGSPHRLVLEMGMPPSFLTYVRKELRTALDAVVAERDELFVRLADAENEITRLRAAADDKPASDKPAAPPPVQSHVDAIIDDYRAGRIGMTQDEAIRTAQRDAAVGRVIRR